MKREVTNCQENGRDDAPDVYSVIRSAEIRDYYRKKGVFTIFEKEQLILHSFIPVQQKTDMLRRLSKVGSVEESCRIDEMCRLYSAYIDMVHYPAVRTVFILECNEWSQDGSRIDAGTWGVEAYDTVSEITGEMDRIYGGMETKANACVTVLHVPQDGKVKEAFQFTIFWIDGKWEIKDLYVEDRELEMQGVSKDTIYRYGDDSLYHPLPFESGSRLKLQLPFMERPIYGILESELDGNGCWYHFLFCEGEGLPSFNLTSAEINLTSGYSSLDWIGRA